MPSSPAKHYILAHDTGTGGDKAVLTDLQDQIVESAYQSYDIYYPKPEWAEQDPLEIWQTVAATTRQVLEKAGIDPRQILGVGITAQMFNLLPVDERCDPVTPMISWLDVRSVHQADRLMSGNLPAFLFRNTGNIPTAKDVIPKILWLKEERLGLNFSAINAIGGGSTSPVWTQIISDITGCTLSVVEHPLEAGAMGAALSVAVGLGIYPNMEAVDEVIKIHHTVEPRPINQPRYNDLYQEYRAL